VDVTIVGSDSGEAIQLGPIRMRILEDGRTTDHRLGVGEITTVLLNTFTPDLYVQYFRVLRDMIAGGQELTPEATIAIMSRYATVPANSFAESPTDRFEPDPVPRTGETP
jgi:hypothetical protein